MATVVVAAGCLCLAAAGPAAAGKEDLLRDVIRQQSAAEQNVCGAVKKTLGSGERAGLVVRTAIELGFNPCKVIRCAIEAGADLAQVLQGAAEAGLNTDVMSRCALEAGIEPGLLAAILADLSFEPNFCYFTFSPGGPPPLPPAVPPVDRGSRPPQLSPYLP